VGEVIFPCPFCREHVDQDSPDKVLVERVEDVPGFGQRHDPVWSRVGFAHKECAARMPAGYRLAQER
jgi:hypothetical protein